MANAIADLPSLCNNRCILELGAGAALPSLVCAKLSPRAMVISDYPDETILESIEISLDENGIDHSPDKNIVVVGYKWGESVQELLAPLRLVVGSDSSAHSGGTGLDQRGFDLVLLSELLWKDTYSSHVALLQSLKACLKPDGEALVSLAHRPTDDNEHNRERDMEFFSRAQSEEFGFRVELLRTQTDAADALSGSGDDNMDVYLYSLKYA
jgi:EEF1A N-terminal glycine/lysine methyltransferase